MSEGFGRPLRCTVGASKPKNRTHPGVFVQGGRDTLYLPFGTEKKTNFLTARKKLRLIFSAQMSAGHLWARIKQGIGESFFWKFDKPPTPIVLRLSRTEIAVMKEDEVLLW